MIYQEWDSESQNVDVDANMVVEVLRFPCLQNEFVVEHKVWFRIFTLPLHIPRADSTRGQYKSNSNFGDWLQSGLRARYPQLPKLETLNRHELGIIQVNRIAKNRKAWPNNNSAPPGSRAGPAVSSRKPNFLVCHRSRINYLEQYLCIELTAVYIA